MPLHWKVIQVEGFPKERKAPAFFIRWVKSIFIVRAGRICVGFHLYTPLPSCDCEEALSQEGEFGTYHK
jgi:hypothetical protein